jgi:hypothetical protein
MPLCKLVRLVLSIVRVSILRPRVVYKKPKDEMRFELRWLSPKYFEVLEVLEVQYLFYRRRRCLSFKIYASLESIKR